jgi:hypothetical protein
MRRLRHRLGLGGFNGFSSDGLSGGLALFWHDQIIVEVQKVSKRYIDVYVRESLSVLQWRLTCVYGESRVENRHRMWDKIRNLKSTSNLPWLVVGDFSEALWQKEHLSNTPPSVNQMDALRKVLYECDLRDLGFSDVPYDSRGTGRANVRVRLDRAVACLEWKDRFSDTRVQHLTSLVSDQWPILVQLEQEVRVPTWPKRQYESDLTERILAVWKEAGQKRVIALKILILQLSFPF